MRFLGCQGIPAWLHPAGTARREVATKPGARYSLFVPWGVGTDRPRGVGAVPEELGCEGGVDQLPRAGWLPEWFSQPAWGLGQASLGRWALPRQPWGSGWGC